jgi:gamma-carbonic anhydrase
MALLKAYRGVNPQIGDGCFLAENATVIGDVILGARVNIWYGAVIRADVGYVRIAEGANLQDLCCVHMTKHRSNTIIEEHASIGHSAIVHGAIVGAGALIGMGVILMDDVKIGEESLVGAGSLVTEGTVIPPRSLALGRPARVIRSLSAEEVGAGRRTAERYLGLAEEHR